ncbi:hypothetical protein [Roseomonas indoligenes]|uniref:Lipoprotein n=1 Tax=Roseomonas indoligenes TaxID=2820811 RepID=A0A940MWF2_9PROT|nr:hypothetical protein [Pararoseomonas indoligenes]MBP0492240.1 hypothetical protein [Pararoseomonas indoligenes]
MFYITPPTVPMLKPLRPIILLAFVVGCAAKPPEPPTAAQIAAPHRVVVDEPRPNVPVDVNLDLRRTAFVGLSPAGLLIGAVMTAGDAVVNSITESNRTARRDELAARLGETGPIASDFARQFNEAFKQQLAGVPALRVERFDQAPRGAQVQLGEGAGLQIYRDVVLTTDGRFLVARATTMHTVGEGAARRSIVRYAAAFSRPVNAPSEEEAVARWTADDSRLIREQAGPLAEELASVVRLAVFSTQPLDIERMPSLEIPSTGVSLLVGTAPNGREGAFWAETRSLGYEVSREGSRVVTVSALGRERNRWTWISMPAYLVQAFR